MGRPADLSVTRAAEGPRQRVRLDAMEVTQAVQDLGHTVPLIAGKPTFVRVYLGESSEAFSVQGELRVRNGPAPWTIVPSLGQAALDPGRSGSTPAELRSRREDVAYSLDFRLPSHLIGPGTLRVQLGQVRDAASGQPVVVTAGGIPKTVTLTMSPPLRVRVINLRYTTGTPPVTYAASATDLALLRSWLGRTFPVPDVQFSSVTVDATATWPFNSGQANAQVAAIRALDMAGGGDQRTHYYGLVADGGGFMRGSAAGIPGAPDPATVASGPTGAATWGWDNDGSYGDWYGGHELGHTFGRFHPGFCGESADDPAYPFPAGQLANNDGAFVGFDVGDAALGLAVAALPGPGWHDVMTYCTTQWLSSYTYAAIRDRLEAEAAMFPGPIAAARAGVSGSAVHVSAVVDLTARSAGIEYVTPLPGAMAAGAPDETRLAVRTQAADGTSQDHPVEFKPDLCRMPGENEIGLVDAVVDVDPSTTRIELLIDGNAVDEFEVGAAPGAAENLQLQRAAPEPAAREAEEAITVTHSILSWDEVPGEPGGVSYVVQASTDQGATWRALAVGATDTSLQFDPEDFADAEQVRFRVLATNGVSYSESSTDDLPVDDL